MERAIYSGVFTDERAQRFVRALVDATQIGFKELYDKLAKIGKIKNADKLDEIARKLSNI